MTSVIRTEGLTKRFGRILAVDGLDLDVREGDVYGFLGANGSGKTTTVRMMLGLVLATSGRAEVLGEEMPGAARSVLPQVGALVEGPAAYPHLSGRRNLALFDAMGRRTDRSTRRARIAEALEHVGLGGVDERPVHAYSLGMRQRLGLAAALLQRPRLLVLDEPTNGLDPQGTREVRSLVGSLAEDGATVLVSSHLLSEVEQVCSHIGIMHAGRLLIQGTATEVRAVQETEARVRTDQPAEAARIMRELGLTAVTSTVTEARGRLGRVAPEKVVASCVHADLSVTGFVVDSPRLEDVFVSLTGEGFDVSG